MFFCYLRPSIEDLVDLCDGAYDVERLLKFELEMFQSLDFDLSQPYAQQFLRRYATVKKDDFSPKCYLGAKYLIELSVLGDVVAHAAFISGSRKYIDKRFFPIFS